MLTRISEEDWLILGMIHAFRSLSVVKDEQGSINDVDFEYLIEIQRRNLSDPSLLEKYQQFIKTVGNSKTIIRKKPVKWSLRVIPPALASCGFEELIGAILMFFI